MIKLRNLIGIVLIFLFFVSVNYDSVLATFYSLLALFTLYYASTDKNRTIRIEKKSQFGKDVLYAIGAFAVLVFTAPFFTQLFFNQLFSIQQVAQAVIFTSVPVFQGLPILEVLITVFTIAIIETTGIFGQILEFLKDISGRKIDIFSKNIFEPQRLYLFAVILGIWTLYHATAKGVRDADLFVVFYFGLLSLVLLVMTGQLLAPILFHIIANGYALKDQILQIISGIPTLYIVIGAVAVYYLYSKRINPIKTALEV